MIPFLFILLLGMLALLQSTILPYTAILSVWPNLMLLVVVSWTLLRGLSEGLVWAFVGGLWLDLLSGGPFGVSALALVLVASLVSLLEASLFREHIVLVMLIVVGASLLHGIFHLLLLRLGHHPAATLAAVWRIVIPAALYTSLLTPAVFPPLRWLHRVTGREQLEW
jgi:rod shape-determining protein MreD